MSGDGQLHGPEKMYERIATGESRETLTETTEGVTPNEAPLHMKEGGPKPARETPEGEDILKYFRLSPTHVEGPVDELGCFMAVGPPH